MPQTESLKGNPYPETPAAPNAAFDPFDPKALRLDASAMAADLGTTRELVTVNVRKPAKDEFVRVHRDDEYTLNTGVLELKTEREIYLVTRPLWGELFDEANFSCRALFSAMSRQGVFFLWPVRLPGPDGKIDPWNASALEAASLARDRWVRISANMPLGAYNVTTAAARISEPVWPEKSMRDLLAIAFKDRFIDSLDHPALKRLRGEI
jgi:hypothetical protein